MDAKRGSVIFQYTLVNFLTVVSIFFGAPFVNASVRATGPMTPILCNRLLTDGLGITAQEIFNQLARIASEEFGARSTKFRQDPYGALTEELVDGKSQHSLPGTFDSTWLLGVPAPDYNIWRRLDSKVRLEVLDILEKTFSEGEYDLTLSIPSGNEDLSTAFKRILAQPSLQALRERNGHQVGFSPILFLGAALSRSNVGICRHSNLAMAGILVELGIPSEDLRVITGFQSPVDHTAGHMFLEIRAASDLPWLTYDATGNLSNRRAQAHHGFDIEPSGSMSTARDYSVETLVATRVMLNSMKKLRERFKHNQIVHTDFSSPDEPIPSWFFSIPKEPPTSREELGKNMSELFDKSSSSGHLPDKKYNFIIHIEDENGT